MTTAIARPRTFLYMVLDESDSMDKIRHKTISSYNEFLDGQRRVRVDELFVSLVKFADGVTVVYKTVPIAKTTDLKLPQYVPTGMTALYDGIGSAIEEAAKAAGPKDRVLIVILTDGEENRSRYWDKTRLRREVAARRELGNWTFVLLGANVDAMKMGRDIGVDPGNTQNYTVEDVGGALATAGSGVKQYRQSDDLNTKRFFNQPKTWERPEWAAGGEMVDPEDDNVGEEAQN